MYINFTEFCLYQERYFLGKMYTFLKVVKCIELRSMLHGIELSASSYFILKKN